MKSKKMTGYGKGGAKKKSAKPMATSVYKKGGAKKKKLKKYQTAGPKTKEDAMFYDAIDNTNIVPFKSFGDKNMTERDNDLKAREADYIFNRPRRLKRINALDRNSLDRNPYRRDDPMPDSIRKQQKLRRALTPSDIVQKGGSTTNAKSLRNYSRGGARKNR